LAQAKGLIGISNAQCHKLGKSVQNHTLHASIAQIVSLQAQYNQNGRLQVCKSCQQKGNQ
jgi:hypothetical protein